MNVCRAVQCGRDILSALPFVPPLRYLWRTFIHGKSDLSITRMTTVETISREGSSPFQTEPKYEKYIVEKDSSEQKLGYIISRVDSTGQTVLQRYSREESAAMLRSDFFSGSILICKNPEHTSLLHKFIHVMQLVNSIFFLSRKRYDLSLTHTAIVFGEGIRTEQYPVAPLAVAHADYPGIVKENYDFLADADCTSYQLYRPVETQIRQIFVQYAHQTAYTLEDTKRYQNRLPREVRQHNLAARERARYDFFSGALGFFWGTPFSKRRFHLRAERPLDQRLARKTGFLIADLLLGDQFKTERGSPKNFICSGYAANVVGGSLMIYGLKDCSSEEINAFISTSEGRLLSRADLAAKITRAIVYGGDSLVEQAFHTTYESIKLTRTNPAGHILPIYLARELDKHVD